MTVPTDDSPPAFPVVPQVMRNPLNLNEQVFHQGSYGMSLRDYFAAAAMAAIVGRESCTNRDSSSIERDAYGIADRMLKARTV